MTRIAGLVAWVALTFGAGCSGDDAGGTAGGGGLGGTVASGGSGGTHAGGAAGSSSGGDAGAPACDSALTPLGTHASIAKDFQVANGSERSIAIGFDPSSQAFVESNVFESGSGTFTLELRKIDVASGQLTPSQAIVPIDSSVSFVPNAFDPSLAAASSGALVLLVWADARLGNGNGMLEVFGQLFDVSGSQPTRVGNNFSVSQQPASDEHAPHVVFDPSAQKFWVAWADDRDMATIPGGRYEYARTVALDGTLGSELALGDATTWQDGVHAAVGSSGTLFVWSEYSDAEGWGRYSARLTGAQNPVVLYQSTSLSPAPPGVAWDSARCRFLVVWQQTDSANASDKQLWATILGPDASVVRPAFRITTQPDGAGAPHLDYSSATATFVVTFGSWLTPDAYALELDGNGDPMGSPESIHATAPANGTYFQDLAAGDGSIVVLANDDYVRVDATLLAAPGGG
jgi:hypothetical protein